jgi:hypothetical protein
MCTNRFDLQTMMRRVCMAPGATRTWLLTTFDRSSARIFPDLADIARPPTKAALAGVLGEAFWQLRQDQARGRNTELVFAFAGHGDVDDGGRGFVVMADGPFTRDDLVQQVLQASPADVNHVVVDACSSYFFVNSRGGTEPQAVKLTPAMLDVLQGDGNGMGAALRAKTGVFVSTSSAAEVHESAALSSGVFSYLFRSALTGAADVDGNGHVEYAETAAYLALASSTLADPRARLQVHAAPPLQRPHSSLLDLQTSGATTFLAVDERGPTHVKILDPRGVPYADIHSDGARPVYVALQGQPFFLVQRRDEEAVLVARTAGAMSLSSLDFGPAPNAARSTTSDPYQGLLQKPLTQAFVDGYLSSAELPLPSGGTLFEPVWSAGGAPPTRLPVGAIGVGVASGAVLLGVGAVGAVVMNQVEFAALERSFSATGQLDARQSLVVDQWRNAATGLTLGALALGLLGGGMFAWSLTVPNGEVSLP